MWELYEILNNGIPVKEEQYLIHESIKILENISTQDFKKSLKLMYKEYEGKNPYDAAMLFVKSLKENDFFSFVQFVRGLKS